MAKKQKSNQINAFMEFIRTQGVVGLAVGFVLGGAVAGLVNSFVNDIINPILGIILGAAGDLSSYSITVGSAQIMYGAFLNTLINFIVIAAVVFYVVKGLGLDKLDKEK